MQVKAATKVQSVARRRLAKRRVTALREKKIEVRVRVMSRGRPRARARVRVCIRLWVRASGG